MYAPTAKQLGSLLTIGVLGFLREQGALSEEALSDLGSGEGELFNSLQNSINELLAEHPFDEMREVYLSREHARESETKRHHRKPMPEYRIKLHEKADELLDKGVGQPWYEVGKYNNHELKETHPNDLNLLTKDQSAKEHFKAEHRTIWPFVKRDRALERLGPQFMLTRLLISMLPDPYVLLEDWPEMSEDVAVVMAQFQIVDALMREAYLTKRKSGA